MKGLVILMGSNSYSHLTLEDRKIIEQGINNNETKASIADKLGKDKSTIGKEIKLQGNARPPARTTLPSTAPEGTEVPVPAMAAPTSHTAGLISSSILPPPHRQSIKRRLSILARAST